MVLYDADGDDKTLILTGTGTDGDGYRVQRGRLGTDLNFTGTDAGWG